MFLLWLACADDGGPPGGAESDRVDSTPVEDSPTGTDSPGDTHRDSDSPPPLDADLLFDGTGSPAPILGFGAQIWPADTTWTTALDPLGARLVRIPINPNLGSPAVELPVDVSASEWDLWMAEHVLDAAPTFFTDLEASLALTGPRGVSWIAHLWEAPPAWETPAGVLLPEHVDDFAALTGALVGWVAASGIEPAWLELCNEPDGDWNSYISPADYDTLVLAVRAELDARGLERIGIVGPGLAVLGGWSDPPEWVPTLSDEAAAALDAWSVHTWDDYAEAGEGHLFLEERWRIFLDQVQARDADKPILVTEMGSKDTVFGTANYGSPDPGVCGAASESDGYAIRTLAHLAVALDAGADGIAFWQAADQSWECSRWGMVDTTGSPRRFHEALQLVLSAVPADAGVVRAETELAAVALLGAEAGVVLIVNDGAERIERTVAVSGGWSLVEARGFGTEDRLLRDELLDLAQVASADKTLAIDSTNTSQFAGDAARAYRTASGDAALTWAPEGELTRAVVRAWSWNGATPVSIRVEASADGATWNVLAPVEAITEDGWYRHDLVLDTFAPGTRQLRLILPAEGVPPWNPQLGDLWLGFRRDDPAILPTGEAPWTVDLPPESAVVLVVGR